MSLHGLRSFRERSSRSRGRRIPDKSFDRSEPRRSGPRICSFNHPDFSVPVPGYLHYRVNALFPVRRRFFQIHGGHEEIRSVGIREVSRADSSVVKADFSGGIIGVRGSVRSGYESRSEGGSSSERCAGYVNDAVTWRLYSEFRFAIRCRERRSEVGSNGCGGGVFAVSRIREEADGCQYRDDRDYDDEFYERKPLFPHDGARECGHFSLS